VVANEELGSFKHRPLKARADKWQRISTSTLVQADKPFIAMSASIRASNYEKRALPEKAMLKSTCAK